MLDVIPLLLLVLPILFQLLFGTKTIYKTDSLKFSRISWISFIAYILFSFIAFYITEYNFSKKYEQYPNPVRCGMPLLGVALACFYLLFVLILIFLIQFFIKRWKDKKAQHHD